MWRWMVGSSRNPGLRKRGKGNLIQEPRVKEKATWLKFSDLKTIEIFPISAAEQPDWKTICSIQTGKTINAHGYLRKGKGGSWASAHLQPLGYSRCWCDEYCELINERGPVQPRSPCELHPVDHSHRPGSHQQSRFCCSNLQSSTLPLILVKHIIWKIWGAPPKTQPLQFGSPKINK